MKAKYTKKQILESIKHWKKVLESMDEKEKQSSGIDAIMKMASQIIPDQAQLAKQMLSEQELNEGTSSGIIMGVMGTLLALSMMGKISLNMKDTLGSVASSKDDVKIVQKCDTSIQQITSALDEIQDNIDALCSTHNLDDSDPSLEDLLDATKEQIKAAEREATFKKIMADDSI